MKKLLTILVVLITLISCSEDTLFEGFPEPVEYKYALFTYNYQFLYNGDGNGVENEPHLMWKSQLIDIIVKDSVLVKYRKNQWIPDTLSKSKPQILQDSTWFTFVNINKTVELSEPIEIAE